MAFRATIGHYAEYVSQLLPTAFFVSTTLDFAKLGDIVDYRIICGWV